MCGNKMEFSEAFQEANQGTYWQNPKVFKIMGTKRTLQQLDFSF